MLKKHPPNSILTQGCSSENLECRGARCECVACVLSFLVSKANLLTSSFLAAASCCRFKKMYIQSQEKEILSTELPFHSSARSRRIDVIPSEERERGGKDALWSQGQQDKVGYEAKGMAQQPRAWGLTSNLQHTHKDRHDGCAFLWTPSTREGQRLKSGASVIRRLCLNGIRQRVTLQSLNIFLWSLYVCSWTQTKNTNTQIREKGIKEDSVNSGLHIHNIRVCVCTRVHAHIHTHTKEVIWRCTLISPRKCQ